MLGALLAFPLQRFYKDCQHCDAQIALFYSPIAILTVCCCVKDVGVTEKVLLASKGGGKHQKKTALGPLLTRWIDGYSPKTRRKYIKKLNGKMPEMPKLLIFAK